MIPIIKALKRDALYNGKRVVGADLVELLGKTITIDIPAVVKAPEKRSEPKFAVPLQVGCRYNLWTKETKIMGATVIKMLHDRVMLSYGNVTSVIALEDIYEVYRA